jgi:hypothetical protein
MCNFQRRESTAQVTHTSRSSFQVHDIFLVLPPTCDPFFIAKNSPRVTAPSYSIRITSRAVKIRLRWHIKIPLTARMAPPRARRHPNPLAKASQAHQPLPRSTPSLRSQTEKLSPALFRPLVSLSTPLVVRCRPNMATGRTARRRDGQDSARMSAPSDPKASLRIQARNTRFVRSLIQEQIGRHCLISSAPR